MCNEKETVAVIGGGLVGPLCALFLAKRNYKVNLYERREDPRCSGTLKGKSINLALSNRARKALKEVDLEETVLKCGIPMKGRFIHNINGTNHQILYDPISSQCLYSVSRSDLNQKLLEATEEHSEISLYFNHKLVKADLDKGILSFLLTKSGETTEVSADLIVGADGAFSTVRRHMQQTPLFSFSQTYLDHGYMELSIPSELSKTMTPNHLHIWPRNKFMMIALPNQDGSWTVTLFMPFDKFKQLKTPETVLEFFRNTFRDSVELIGENVLVKQFLNAKPSSLVSIKCSSFHFGKNTLLIGDAAHAMVPFYGQGMNAGFEDCSILNSILESYGDNLASAIQKFTDVRKDDANAICDLAMYNYVEMRDLVTKPSYRIRKAFDEALFKLFPNVWIPLYNSVTFTEMNYTKCIDNRAWQDKVVNRLLLTTAVILSILAAFILRL